VWEAEGPRGVKPPVLGSRVCVPLAVALSGRAVAAPIARWSAAPGGTTSVEDVVEVEMPVLDRDGRGVAHVAGAGHRGPRGTAGDVKVLVEVVPESGYEFIGDGDVAYHHELQLREALLGFELRYQHPCGRVFDVRAAGHVVSPGDRHSLPGQGLARGDGTRGDMVLVFGVAFPKSVGVEHRSALELALA
jgi:DnaJ-class molecular chaperone